MINNILNTDGFYFATDYDLTHSLQRLANTSPEFQEMSLLERVRHTHGRGGVCEGGVIKQPRKFQPLLCVLSCAGGSEVRVERLPAQRLQHAAGGKRTTAQRLISVRLVHATISRTERKTGRREDGSARDMAK